MRLLGHLHRLSTLGRGLVLGLPADVAARDPIALFGEWFEAAQKAALLEPTAMTLATCTADGRPSARMVLLKGYDAAGFVFYTNYGSRKARELEANPRAALVFHWPRLMRQIRVEGEAKRTSQEESRAYFRSRPRASRIGAWASRQSEPLESRETLETEVNRFRGQFADGDVPLPPFWGGYRVVPQTIEFWQGRANRLHDRVRFEKTDEVWQAQRLYP